MPIEPIPWGPPPPRPIQEEKTGIYGGMRWKKAKPDPVPAPHRSPGGGGFGVRDALNLSQGHNSTLPFLMEVREGGGILRIRQPASPFESSKVESSEGQGETEGGNLLRALRGISDSGSSSDGPKRGKISEWSMSSRNNLRRQLAAVELGAIDRSVFVGITYPAEFPAPEEHEVYKGHMRAFQMRVRRKYPAVSWFWKLEFQERGAAHFHLIVFGLGEGDAALVEWENWSKNAWYEVVGSGDERKWGHKFRGVKSERVRSRGGVVGYLATYLSKDDQTRPGDFTGRYWGKHNESALPMAPLRKSEETDFAAVKMRRVMRKCMESQVNARRREAARKKVVFWAEHGATWMDIEAWLERPGCDRFLPRVTPQWTGPTRLTIPNPASSGDWNAPPLPFRKPRRFRSKRNLTVTFFCDASKVAGQLQKWISETWPEQSLSGKKFGYRLDHCGHAGHDCDRFGDGERFPF